MMNPYEFRAQLRDKLLELAGADVRTVVLHTVDWVMDNFPVPREHWKSCCWC